MTTMIDGDEFVQYKNVNMNIKCWYSYYVVYTIGRYYT